jgi:hypothetical protein
MTLQTRQQITSWRDTRETICNSASDWLMGKTVKKIKIFFTVCKKIEYISGAFFSDFFSIYPMLSSSTPIDSRTIVYDCTHITHVQDNFEEPNKEPNKTG